MILILQELINVFQTRPAPEKSDGFLISTLKSNFLNTRTHSVGRYLGFVTILITAFSKVKSLLLECKHQVFLKFESML